MKYTCSFLENKQLVINLRFISMHGCTEIEISSYSSQGLGIREILSLLIDFYCWPNSFLFLFHK